MPLSNSAKRPLRQDAERNKDLLAAAAREVFRDQGAYAPIAEIARRAGVSKATLYRRFPERSDLLAFVFADRLYDCVGSAKRSLNKADPWGGFVEHIEHLVELQREDRAFTSVFLFEFPPGSGVAQARVEAGNALRSLIAAAKSQGTLRSDVSEVDVLLLLQANDGVLKGAPNPDVASKRLVELMLRAMHTWT